MRKTSILLVAAIILIQLGCTGRSTVEKEYFISPEARQFYIAEHPDGTFNEYIKNGEIIRGMDFNEVIASWGLPNVYLHSTKAPREYWFYYVEDPSSNTVLIYTLSFEQDILGDWDIDIKRFDGRGLEFDNSATLSSGESVAKPNTR
jgi:hypothetical protein